MSEPIIGLPVPVGPDPVDPIAAGRRLDLLELMDDRAASVVSPVLAAVLVEAERLRARVAELEQQLAGKDRPVDEDPIVYALTEKAEQPDKLTRLFAPTQALREVSDGEHYPLVHHDYREGRDLPETGGPR